MRVVDLECSSQHVHSSCGKDTCTPAATGSGSRLWQRRPRQDSRLSLGKTAGCGVSGYFKKTLYAKVEGHTVATSTTGMVNAGQQPLAAVPSCDSGGASDALSSVGWLPFALLATAGRKGG